MTRRQTVWRRALGLSLAAVVLLAGGFAAGVAAERAGALTRADDVLPRAGVFFGTFWQAWDLVHQHYVDRQALDTTRLTYGAIRGMVDALGDEGHSRFLTPKDLEHQKSTLAGRLEGVGAELALRDQRPTIETVYPGSPAERAGLRAGDAILRVDGADVAGLALGQVIELVRGPAGTTVTLTILRPGQPSAADLAVVRARITVPSVWWARVPGTSAAHVLISHFTEQTTEDLVNALKAARAGGATALVLDLRNNGGGLLSGAIEAATQFVAEGTVYLEEDARGERKAIPVRFGGGAALDLPMVVLVNGGTTSAGEILAGALQGNRRGPLVGTKTYGTGTVLFTYMLSDGSAIMLGAVQWLTPDGRRIWRQGIAPDLSVTLPPDTSPLTPRRLAALAPAELQASRDAQFLRALEELGQVGSAQAATSRSR